MAIKPRYKRIFGWTLVGVLAGTAVAVVFVPPAITLNYMKPQLTLQLELYAEHYLVEL